MDDNFNDNNLEEESPLIIPNNPMADCNKDETVLGTNDNEETEMKQRKNSFVLNEKPELSFLDPHNSPEKINIKKKEEMNAVTREDDKAIKIVNETKVEDVSYLVLRKEVIENKIPVVMSLMDLPKYKNFFITVHPFIINGYRINHSLKDCLVSIFTFHNETLNIWTHLIPFFVFLGLFIYNLIDHQFKSYMIVHLFMFTTFLFLLFSSIHHTFNCHSNEVWQCCYKMDLLGIMFQLVTSTMCCLQFMFHDFDELRRIYAYSFLALGSITIILSMFDFFISAKLNLFLMFSYATLFLISFLSSIHWVAVAKIDEVETISPYILLGFVFIFLGFAIFLAKFPECIFQNKFIDYFLNSHIIWHLCVVGAAVCYYMMLHNYYTLVAEDR